MPEIGWTCDECGERVRYVGGGEYECRCDHPRKVTPKRKAEVYTRSTP